MRETTAAAIENPIAFELFRNTIVGIANEMALTIYRAAYSGVLKNIMDYSTAICDRNGRLAAQGLSLPGHLCSIPVALQAFLAALDEEDPLAPGDVLIMNDPYTGGMHLPDIFAFKPVFAGDALVAFAATVCHHTDVGGRVAGSNASDSTEIFQEGLRIPPVKLYRRGVLDRQIAAIMKANVRMPERLDGDLRAQLAACRIAEDGVRALAERHGPDGLMRLIDALMDYSEILTRDAIAKLPDGEATFLDHIDDDGIDVGVPIPLRCTIRKAGGGMVVDWTGSSPQVKGAINNTFSYTAAASYTAVKSVLEGDAPNNDGVFRAVEVIAPEGTIANAVMPAACAARGLTGFRMTECAFGALAGLAPDRVFACSDGGNTGVTIGGWTRERKPFIYVDFLSGAWGGRPDRDGLDGNTHMFANMASYSTEVVENDQPLLIEANEFVSDTPGHGKYRGGLALRRDWRLLEDEAILQVRADRQAFPPYGLAGGWPGRGGRNVMHPGRPDERELHSKLTATMRRGEVFRHELPSGGGWGDPLERDPEMVREDVADDVVSAETALSVYGVVLKPDGTVDHPATANERSRRTAVRDPAA